MSGFICKEILPTSSPETIPTNSSNDVCLECLFPDNCFPNNTCRPGTTGSFCEKCDSDFYRIGSVCLQCPTIPWPAVCFSVYIAIFLASCFFYGFKESVCTKTKLLLHYLQLMLLTLHVKIAWPQLLAQMISALSFGVFNSNILIPGCVLGSFETMTIHYLEWYTSLCIPVVVYIIWYLLDKSLKVIIDRHGREMQKSSEKRRNKMGQRLKLRRFVWLVAVVMYMPALVSSMRTFQCSGTISKDMVFDEKKELFLLDTNHSCRTFTFQLIHSVAVVYVIFIILGTFLLLFFMLRQRKWKLLEKGWMLYSPIYESYKSKYCFWEAVPMLRKLACIMVTESHPVSHIYESYKSKYCFWEAVPMFRKLASIMVTESHPVRPLWQVTVQLALTLAYLLLVMVFWPYRACFWKYKNLNNHIAFEILSNISVLLLQVVGLAVVMGRYREEYAYIQILSVVAVLLVWLVQMASIKCEFETETDVEEIDNTEISDTDEIRTSYHRQKYCNCLTWWKKNRVEPGPHKQKKVKERQQNIDF